MVNRIPKLSVAQRRVLQSMIDWGVEKPMELRHSLCIGWWYDNDNKQGVNASTGHALKRKGFIERVGGDFDSDLYAISTSGLAAVLSIHEIPIPASGGKE